METGASTAGFSDCDDEHGRGAFRRAIMGSVADEILPALIPAGTNRQTQRRD